MLVLSRNLNEEIIIGGNIRVKIIAIRGGRVRLGIQAPDDVRVRRSELELTIADYQEEREAEFAAIESRAA